MYVFLETEVCQRGHDPQAVNHCSKSNQCLTVSLMPWQDSESSPHPRRPSHLCCLSSEPCQATTGVRRCYLPQLPISTPPLHSEGCCTSGYGITAIKSHSCAVMGLCSPMFCPPMCLFAVINHLISACLFVLALSRHAIIGAGSFLSASSLYIQNNYAWHKVGISKYVLNDQRTMGMKAHSCNPSTQEVEN